MKRLKLLLAMLALLGVLVASVVLGSPYAPVVQPVGDIEEIWAIEDARSESAGPLVTALENHGVPLAYDALENTFYCTLGLGHGDEWPQLHLTAPGAEDVQLVFVDDYSYDWCQDAIRDGYTYEVMAYTDKEYAYFYIAFTGLPIVNVRCDTEIGIEDTPAHVSVSVFAEEPVESAANIHLRGGGTLNLEKKNLRVKFTRAENGKKNMVNLPGFGLRENILLNPMALDETMLRERASWTLYGEMLGAGYDGAFGARKTAYAEVFLNDEYQGVYLMMEPIDAEEELAKEGSQNLLTDSVYRSLIEYFVDDRPVTGNPLNEVGRYELRYEPTQTKSFAPLEAYLKLMAQEDDEAFVEMAACMDMESVVRYVLLRQLAGLADNISNNMYIWARHTAEGFRYTLAPWDMDMSWGRKPEAIGENDENWMSFPLVDRMLVCGVPGLKELMVERWQEWREDVFTQEHISEMLEGYAAELENSGALMRNSYRWNTPVNSAAAEELSGFAATRMEMLDIAMDMFADEQMAYPPFLSDISGDQKGYPIL